MEFLLFSALIGFLVAFLGGPYARKYLVSSGIYGIDQQKKGKPKLPTSGGLLVLFGFIAAVTSFLGFTQLLSSNSFSIPSLLAALSSVTIIALIGLVDDIHIKRDEVIENVTTPTEKYWNKLTDKLGGGMNKGDEELDREGIGQFTKMLFVLPAALPLISVGAGSWYMVLPVVGEVYWGLVYPLFLLPIGLLFVSNVVNMLAGTNGLSAGMSFVAAIGLGTFGVLRGQMEAAVIAFGLAAPLLGFMYYNRYPSSILPGDSLTYLCGAALFSAMVVGDMEKFGVFIFMPWFVEFFLKARSGFKAHSWGLIQDDGSLKPQYSKNYSLTHPLMRRGYNEKQITFILVALELAIVLLGLFLFQTFQL